MTNSFLHARWLDLVHLAGLTSFTLGFSFRFEGTDNVPAAGPALLIANHQSFLDPYLVGVCTQRRLVYLARKTLFRNPWFGALIRSLNSVPIDQDGVGKEGLRIVLDKLAQGHAVLVFPEGSRTPDGPMHELKPGIHLLMRRTQATIVPVGIAGAYQAWPIWRPYPIPAPLFLPAGNGTIAVSIGKPLDSKIFADMPRDETLGRLFAEIECVQRRAENLRRH
jgi:1-acyl-sn-glycerol-3-phosphate acyltransferase